MPNSMSMPIPAEPYRDRKRYAWLLSLLVPCTVGVGPALMMATGDPLALWFPVAFFYLVAPLLDWSHARRPDAGR